MSGGDYAKVVGIQKKKLEYSQKKINDLNEKKNIMREKLEKLGVDVDKLLDNNLKKKDLFDSEIMFKQVFKDFYNNSTSNLATLERYSKNNKRKDDLDFFVKFCLNKFKENKIDNEKVFILRMINKSLNFYVSFSNIQEYSFCLLDMLDKDHSGRYTIVKLLENLYYEIIYRYNNEYLNKCGENILKELKIKFDSKKYKDLLVFIYEELLKKYENNKGRIKRSVGIAIERCNFVEFKKIIIQSKIKNRYKVWSTKSLYNREKWN